MLTFQVHFTHNTKDWRIAQSDDYERMPQNMMGFSPFNKEKTSEWYIVLAMALLDTVFNICFMKYI